MSRKRPWQIREEKWSESDKQFSEVWNKAFWYALELARKAGWDIYNQPIERLSDKKYAAKRRHIKEVTGRSLSAIKGS